MVKAAWEGQRQGKLRWRLVAILTRKSFVTLSFWDERQTEPSHSLFPPQSPSGQLELNRIHQVKRMKIQWLLSVNL